MAPHRPDEPAGGRRVPPAGSTSVLSRRRFLALSAATACAALGGYAGLVEPRRAGFTFHAANQRTSAAQRRFTLAQISDLHLHAVGEMHHRIAARVNAIRPDLVLFTGDAIDRRERLADFAALLALFDPRTAKRAILGNWEHWCGVDLDELSAVYRAAGCRLLINESVVDEAGGRSLAVTGLDDLSGGRPDPRRAFAGTAGADAHLLLAHCPEQRDRLADAGALITGTEPPIRPERITLMLSGHTHGGQVNLLGWTPVLPAGSGRYVRGWFRGDGGAPLYVSRGIGTSVLPFRLGAPPEVAIFTLWV